MPGSATAEIYFIAAMMVLILVISAASVYFFFRQYRKEKKEKPLRADDIANKSSGQVTKENSGS